MAPATMRLALAVIAVAMSHKVSAKDIWAVNIDNGPAPPPDEGPPLSRNAIRDPTMLKWEILGIVLGYIFVLGFIYTMLFTVGRRLRRAAESSTGTLSMEMMKPGRWATPQDASKGRWAKFANPKQLGGRKDSAAEDQYDGPVSFDQKVIEQDRLRQQQDMERLYAAVMSTDTKSPKQVQVETKEIQTDGYTHRSNSSSSTSTSHANQYTTRTTTPPTSTAPTFTQPLHSPKHTRNFSGRDAYAPVVSTPPPLPPPPKDYAAPPSSPRGTPSAFRPTHSRQASGSSTYSARKALTAKALRISAPRPTALPTGADYAYDDDDETAPLSPRLPPPHHNSSNKPSSSRLRDPPITPIQDHADYTDIDEDEDHSSGRDSEDSAGGEYPYARRRPLPQAAPQRPQQQGNPPPLPPPPKGMAHAPSNTSLRTLPLRAYAATPPPATRVQDDAITAVGMHATAAMGTKTTLLSPRRDRFAAGAGRGYHGDGAALLSAGLASPYSPYMPLSPMTPVTPRLVHRDERRRRDREEGRRVVTQDDVVRTEGELWDSAW